MNLPTTKRRNGIALIIVLMVIVVLGALAGGFAAAMQVETRLARNARFETDLEWIGRSGVEYARYVLAQEAALSNEPWDSLNQKWAGGPVGTNEILAAISLDDNPLGPGSFSIRIIDQERKFNVNQIREGNSFILRHALEITGADQVDFTGISDAFLDWTDRDDLPRLGGAESGDYVNSPNPGFSPYVAKDGPIDDITELLRVRGISPEMFWGGSGKARRHTFRSEKSLGTGNRSGSGLFDLFTTVSFGTLNLNTASAEVLQLLPGIDSAIAEEIVSTRAGLDGIDGTEDDTPFRSADEIANLPGMIPQLAAQLVNFLSTRSYTFEVLVEAKIGEQRREFSALLIRNSSRTAREPIQVCFFHWN